MMTRTVHRRSAFTLVEMLVAAALIIFMMYVLASAFEKGLEAFRILRAQGEMNEKLRSAASALRLDLSTPHFPGSTATNTQGPFLSDQRLNSQDWQPPPKGYFRISLPGIAGTTQNLPARWNGAQPAAGLFDRADGVNSPAVDPDSPQNSAAGYYRMSAVPTQTFGSTNDFYLQFTINLTDGHPTVRDARGRRDQFFMTDTYDGSGTGYGKPIAPNSTQPDFTGDGTLNLYAQPAYNQNDVSLHPLNATQSGYLPKNSVYSTLYTSTWAEVVYFVVPNGRTTVGQVPLFDLYRRQKLLVEPAPPNPFPLPYPLSVPTDPNTGRVNGNYGDLSIWSPKLQVGSNQVQLNVFNGAAHVTEPQRRWGMMPPQPTTAFVFGQPATTTVQNPVQPFPPVINQYGPDDPKSGGDLLLTDLVNVEVKALWEPVRVGAPNTDRFAQTVQGALNPDFVEPSPNNNPDYPFDWLPQGVNPSINGVYAQQGVPPPVIFDTWSCNTDTPVPGGPTFNYGPATNVGNNPPPPNNLTPVGNTMLQQELGMWNVGHFTPIAGLTPQTGPQQNPYQPTQYTIPLRVRVRALQIKLRIWDQKTNQTRQITIIQDV